MKKRMRGVPRRLKLRREKEFKKRASQINKAELIYRAVLEACVGWGKFQNIDARATDEKISLHQAAKIWVEGALFE